MPNSKVIIVCSSNKRLNEELNFILSFLGEKVEFYNAAKLASNLNKFNKAIVLLDTNDKKAKELTTAYLHIPFLSIGKSSIKLLNNLVDELVYPFNYDDVMLKLHHAQIYINNLPIKSDDLISTKIQKSLVGQSKSVHGVRYLIEQVASKNANVLILGESGTGKEVVARTIHENSNRADQVFVPVNCGAIPADLLESELFGHEKGAFTGAFSMRKGRFELAQGGTLFLDEIGDMPMPMQVKLLRVLQERTFERVGGNKLIKADVRVIAATHRNLEQMIKNGDFREDLYYRLNVFPIDMPSLAQRHDDVPLLLRELLNRHKVEHKASVKLTKNALESLQKYHWPGNVRELSNLAERLLILYPNQIVDISELPQKYQTIDTHIYKPQYPDEITERDLLMSVFAEDNLKVSESEKDILFAGFGNEVDQEIIDNMNESEFKVTLPSNGINLKEYLSNLEVELIQQALDLQDGIVARAADHLGIRRTTLVEKMRKYGLNKD